MPLLDARWLVLDETVVEAALSFVAMAVGNTLLFRFGLSF